jgi:hypothetical protein
LVEWAGQGLGQAQWRTALDLNRGPVPLKHWVEYEAALRRVAQDQDHQALQACCNESSEYPVGNINNS